MKAGLRYWLGRRLMAFASSISPFSISIVRDVALVLRFVA